MKPMYEYAIRQWYYSTESQSANFTEFCDKLQEQGFEILSIHPGPGDRYAKVAVRRRRV